MAGFVHNFDVNEGMGRAHPEYFADGMNNRPHQEIEVRIRLSNLRSVPSEVMNKLKRLLKGTHNMVLVPEPSTEKVIISGIPPDTGFGPQQVLNIVSSYVEDWSPAELARER